MKESKDIFVGELKGRLDAVDKYLDNLNDRIVSHNEEISEIKQEQTGIKTKIAIWASVIGTIVAFGTDIIKAKIGL